MSTAEAQGAAVYIDTLGCAKNEYDSQVLAAALLRKGCHISDRPEDADIIIVNTCGFIEAAKVESIDHIFDMVARRGRRTKLVVTGCLSERYHKELAEEMPEVDVFFGVNDYERLPELLLTQGEDTHGDSWPGTAPSLGYQQRELPENSYSAVLKIAEGCDRACSFCAIPQIRGPYRSKPMEAVLREAEQLAEQGVRELILIAQDTSRYGVDIYGASRLPELLRELAKIDGIAWIRLLYVYDDGITDELIEVMATEQKICHYIDMPIQHASDSILSAMHRSATAASIRDVILRLRTRMPDIHIRTTLLLGFPGETEKDVAVLEDFLREERLERVGAFAFSDEEGTPAHELPGQLDEESKQERRDRILALQAEISAELNERKIGSCYEVMIDECLPDACYIGRSRYDAPEVDNEIAFTGFPDHVPGDIVTVRIREAYAYDLVGEEVCEASA